MNDLETLQQENAALKAEVERLRAELDATNGILAELSGRIVEQMEEQTYQMRVRYVGKMKPRTYPETDEQ